MSVNFTPNSLDRDKERTVASKAIRTLSGLALAAVLVLAASVSHAKDNYCAECHTSKEVASFGNVMGWDKSVYQEKNTLCPGLIEIKKGTFFTESRLVKYNEYLSQMEEKTRRYSWYMKEDLVKSGVAYADLASMNPASIDAFTTPNLKIKKGMNDLYEKYNKLQDDYMMEKIIGLALIGVMLVSLLISFGLKNTLKD